MYTSVLDDLCLYLNILELTKNKQIFIRIQRTLTPTLTLSSCLLVGLYGKVKKM